MRVPKNWRWLISGIFCAPDGEGEMVATAAVRLTCVILLSALSSRLTGPNLLANMLAISTRLILTNLSDFEPEF